MSISRGPIAAAACLAILIGATALVARPVTELAPVPVCTVSQRDIDNAGTTPVAETLRTLPTAPGKCPPPSNPAPVASPLSAFDQRILQIHNQERALVGAPPLRWDPLLAQHAADYARVLAQTGQLVHAPRANRGIERENLERAPLDWSPDRLIDGWSTEKRLFHYGLFPNVCDGDWSRCAHYSQMIWPATTGVGCGKVPGLGFDWFVCRYSPGGNEDGKPVGKPRQIAVSPPPPPPPAVVPPPAAVAETTPPVPNFSTKRRVAFCGHMWIIVDTYDSQGKKTGETSLHFSPAGYEINPTSQDAYPKGFAVAIDSTRDADKRLVDMWRYQIANQSKLVHLPVIGPWSPGNNCWTQSLWWAWYGIEPNEPVHNREVGWPSDCTISPAPDWAEKTRRLHKAWDKADTVAGHLDVVGEFMSEAFRSAKDFCASSGD